MEGNSLTTVGYLEENVPSSTCRREGRTLMQPMDGREIPMDDVDLCVCVWGGEGIPEVKASETGGLGRWLNG